MMIDVYVWNSELGDFEKVSADTGKELLAWIIALSIDLDEEGEDENE